MTSPGASGRPRLSSITATGGLLAIQSRHALREALRRGGQAAGFLGDRPGLRLRRSRAQGRAARARRSRRDRPDQRSVPCARLHPPRPPQPRGRRTHGPRAPAPARWSGTRHPASCRARHPRPPNLCRHARPGNVEGFDVGALERIDGLLAVAHGEHGARSLARAFAGEELRRSARAAMSHCAGAVSCTSSSSR